MAISPINLGNFYTNSSGTSVASGLSSGLNTDSLIKALTASQDSQVTKLKDQVDINNKQSASLTSLKQILSSLQSAITPLSNPGSFDPTTNLFAVRTTQITSNTTQAATNFVNATVTSGTASGTYSITDISQLATYTTQETNAFTVADANVAVVVGTPAVGYFSPGTVVVNGQSLTFTTGDSLNDIAQTFNAVSDDTGIKASVLQTSPGQFKLIFASATTGEDARFDLNDSGTLSSDPSGVFTNVTRSPAQLGDDAMFKLNNVTITRPTNTIDDLISGVTFNLLQDTTATPGAAITVAIAPDIDSIAQGVVNFSNAYNKFLAFYASQTERDSGGIPKETAILVSDPTLAGIFNSVTTFASSLVKGLADGEPNSFSSLGITFTDYAGDSTTPPTSNIMSVDSTKLKSLLLTNFTGVENVFGDSFTTSSSDLLLYKGATDAKGITSFTLDIDQTNGSYIAHYLDSDGNAKTASFNATELSTGGISLKADDASIFAGMTLIFGSTADVLGITVTATQGLVSRMKNIVDAAVKSSSGLIALDQQAIVTKNTTLQKQIDTVTSQTETLRQSLLQKYSQLEAAISKANSVLNLLNAQQLAGQN